MSIVKKDKGDKDVIIHQEMDMKILKQILAGAKDNSTIIVNHSPVNITKQVIQQASEGISLESPTGDVKNVILYILDGLPDPKVVSLKELVYKAAYERFEGNTSMAARYLGIHRKTIEANIGENKDV